MSQLSYSIFRIFVEAHLLTFHFPTNDEFSLNTGSAFSEFDIPLKMFSSPCASCCGIYILGFPLVRSIPPFPIFTIPTIFSSYTSKDKITVTSIDISNRGLLL